MNDDLLQPADWRQRKQAIEALHEASPEETPRRLLAIIRENHRDLNALSAALQVSASLRAGVLPELVSLLDDTDPEVRAYALLILAGQDAPQTIPALLRAVSDPDPHVRFNAIEALGNLQAVDAVEPLVDIIRQRDFYLSFAALAALVKIGAEMAVDEIGDLLDDEILAPAAAEALGRLGNLTTIPVLLRWLDSPAGEVGPVAVGLVELQRRMTGYHGDPDLVPLAVAETISATGQDRLLAALDSAMQKTPDGAGSAALPALVTVAGWVLGHPLTGQPGRSQADFTIRGRAHLVQMLGQPRLRAAALDALRQTGKGAIPSLTAKLEDPDPEVRRAAMVALGAIGDDAAVPALIEALAQEEGDLVAVAAGALGKIGARAAFEPLCAQLSHPSALVRQTVVAAINSLGHPQHTERMLALAQARDPLVREAAIRSLGYFGDPRSLDALLRACRDEAPAVRLAATDSVAFYDDPRTLATAQASLSDPVAAVRAAAARTLRFAPPALAIGLLRQALHDPDMWVRVHACRSLAQFRDPAVADAVAVLATDRMPPVRAAAAEALGVCDGNGAIAVLQTLLQDEEPEVVAKAVQALGATHHPAAVPILFDLAFQPAEETRRLALAALGQHGAPACVTCLGRLADQNHEPAHVFSALLQTRAPEAAEMIVQALQRVECRKEAIEAAGQLKEDALASLDRLLQKPGGTLETRLAVAQVLQRIHSERATGLLTRLLQDPASQVRLAAIYALSEVGSLPARAAIMHSAQTDPDSHVQRRARLAAQRGL